MLAALRDEGLTVRDLLARGEVTLGAVAAACYGGDLDVAKRAIYPRRYR